MSRGHRFNQSHQVWQWSVKGVQSYRALNFALLHRNGLSPINCSTTVLHVMNTVFFGLPVIDCSCPRPWRPLVLCIGGSRRLLWTQFLNNLLFNVCMLPDSFFVNSALHLLTTMFCRSVVLCFTLSNSVWVYECVFALCSPSVLMLQSLCVRLHCFLFRTIWNILAMNMFGIHLDWDSK